jgi:hypothetical protein
MRIWTYLYIWHRIAWSVHVQWGPWRSLSSCCFGGEGGGRGGFVAFKLANTSSTHKHTKLSLIRIWSMKMMIITPRGGGGDSSYTYPKWHNWPRVCSMMTKGLCISYTCSTHNWLLGIARWWPIVMKLFIYTKKNTHTHTHTHTIVPKDGLMMAHSLETLPYKHTNWVYGLMITKLVHIDETLIPIWFKDYPWFDFFVPN